MFSPRAQRLSQPVRLLLASLLLFVFAGRVLAMPGWMPTLTQETLTVTLCSGQGTVDIQFDRDHDPDKQAPGHDKPCVFAATNDHAPPPSVIAPVRTLAYAGNGYQLTALAAGSAQGGTTLPPSTGPPLA